MTTRSRGARGLMVAWSLTVLGVLCSLLSALAVRAQDVTIKPGENIQEIVERKPAGTTFLIKAGVHRLESITPKDGDKFIGEPGAVLSGAKLLSSFEQEGRYWVTHSETKQGEFRGKCLPDRPACTLPNDLFVDDLPLMRVNSRSDAGPGTWFADEDKIYLGENPAGHKVELSVLPHAFYGHASNVTVRGLAIEKYACPSGGGAVHGMEDPAPQSHDWIVENNEIRLSHGAGIRLGHGMRVINNKLHHNGQLGLGGGGRDILIEGNEISYNNFAGYDFGWEAGGANLHFCENLIVRNNYVHHNLGPGLHTDTDNIHVLYEHNRTASNRAAGIFHEVSFDAVIRYNTVEDDGYSPRGSDIGHGAGIVVVASSNVEVYGNTVRNCMNGIGVTQYERGSSRTGKQYLVQNVYVHDNDITQTTGTAIGIAKGSKFDDSVFTRWNNHFENNTYRLANPNGKYFEWMNSRVSRSEWQRYGHDIHGKWLSTPTNPSRDEHPE